MATIDISSQSGAVGNGDLQLQNGVPMDGTLRFVTDALNTPSPLKLSTSLVQTTSTLKITTNDDPYIDAEDGTGNNRFTVGRAISSQQVNVDFASNPTGSTTAVGAIRTYRDGVNLSEAMTFIEDGSVGIGTSAPVGILHLYKSAAATRLAIDGDAGQNRLISYRTGALQRFGLYVNNTAESGSNAGSNFAIRAYSDAGTLLSTPFFIERATGNVGIGTTTPASPFSIVNTIALAAGATNPRIENIAYTINNSGAQTGTATGIFLNATETALNGQTHNLLDLQVGGVSKARIANDGSFNMSGNNFGIILNNGSANYLRIAYTSNDARFDCNNLVLVGITGGAFTGLIKIGGVTSSFPAIKRNGAAIDFRLADDSAYCSINLLSINAVGNSTLQGSLAVGTGSGVASAILVADSTTRGFLPPRMTTAQKNAISSPATGLVVFDTDLGKLCVFSVTWQTVTSV